MKQILAFSLVLAAMIGALISNSISAQNLELGEVIHVRVVNLEVAVTDKRGNRVLGLGSDEFTLHVDGKEVAIDYFTEVFSGTAVQRSEEPSISGVPQLVPGEPVSTSYLVFIDEYFSREEERDRALDAIEDQLSILLPEDRMAIVAYNGEGVEMLSTWSQSQRHLSDVIDKARLRETGGFQWEALLKSYQVDIAIGTDAAFREDRSLAVELTTTEERAVQDIHRQVDRIVLAASSTLRGFANPPGRKVMLLLSGGWPFDPVQFVTRDRLSSAAGTSMETREDLYAPLIDTANRLSYTLYTVDTPGMRAYSTSSARSYSLEEAESRRLGIIDRQEELRGSLIELAQSTGGRFFLDGSRDKALEQVAMDTRSYYWLGFTPSWKGDDESHDIRIKMRDKSLKARFRSSYSDLSRKAEVSMMVESSLLFGSSPSTEPLLAQFGQAGKVRGGKMTVPLSIIIPMGSLTFLPHDDIFVAQTELRIAVVDDKGNRSDIPVIELPLVLERPPRKDDLRRFDTEIRLRDRQHDVVVSLYDTISGKILSTRLAILR